MGAQNDFFEALGPTPAPPNDSPGFFTHGTNIFRGADVAGKQFGARGTGTDPGAPGVIGQAGPGDADGVQGRGNGTFSGVAGFGGTTPDFNVAGTGVIGVGGVAGVQSFTLARGPGVRGIGGGGNNTGPNATDLRSAVGVWGQGGLNSPGIVGHGGTGQEDADGVQGFGSNSFSGVAGFGDGRAGNGTGVFGAGGAPNGPGIRGIGNGGPNTPAPANNAVGVLGQGGRGNSDGLLGFGTGSGAGVRGTGGLGGVFEGTIAPLRLIPSTIRGKPTSGNHQIGEFYADSAGELFYCVASGTPGTWKQVQLV